MITVLAILAPGFEEIETVTPIDLLRRAGVEVTLAALGNELQVTGKCGLNLQADITLDNCKVNQPDCLFLPGGPGVKHLRNDPRVISLVQRHNEARRLIAAICAAPTVLHEAGILSGHRYTAHFAVAEELTAILAHEKVVLDGNILTSRGAGTALEFGLALVEALLGHEKSREIADSICWETN